MIKYSKVETGQGDFFTVNLRTDVLICDKRHTECTRADRSSEPHKPGTSVSVVYCSVSQQDI